MQSLSMIFMVRRCTKEFNIDNPSNWREKKPQMLILSSTSPQFKILTLPSHVKNTYYPPQKLTKFHKTRPS